MKFPTRPLLVLLGLVVALGFAEIAIRAMEPLPAPSTWPTAETQLKSRQMSAIDSPVECYLLDPASRRLRSTPLWWSMRESGVPTTLLFLSRIRYPWTCG